MTKPPLKPRRAALRDRAAPPGQGAQEDRLHPFHLQDQVGRRRL
jgi:hypothetical protein